MDTINNYIYENITKGVGGWENVSSLTHCITRLRFTLYDHTLTDTEALEKSHDIMGVIKNGSSVQIVIGNNVSTVYKELVKINGIPSPNKSKKVNLSAKKLGGAILDAIIGTMSPLIPAIIGGSVLKLMAMLLPLTGLVSKDSSTIQILSIIGDGAFFFLPVMVAASAALKFKTNMALAIAIAGVLVHPDFIALMNKASHGDHITFMNLSVLPVK